MQRRATIGRCPSCTESISNEHLLFETEFESAGGSITYAECPSCRAIVNPYPEA